MKTSEIQDLLQLKVLAGKNKLDNEVTGGYCGDLLSDVMANSTQGSLWITIQSHNNIVAVAVLRELAGIILANGRLPDDNTKAKADKEGVPILSSTLSPYHLAGRLYGLGIGVTKE